VDTKEARVVALQVKPAFKPLFQVWIENEDPEKQLVRVGADVVHGGPEES